MKREINKLLPCPFCGNSRVAQGASREYISVWCDCGARGPEVPFPDYCIDPVKPIKECHAAWNHRASTPAPSGLAGEAVARQNILNLAAHVELGIESGLDTKRATENLIAAVRSALAVPPSIPAGGVREALEPFAKLADEIDVLRHEDDSTCLHRIAASDLRRARDTLATLSLPAGGVAVSDAWQPIETAPKDGTYFIGFWPHASRSFAHHQGQYRTCWTGWGGGCWEADALGRPVQKPTHWMPLPAPPAALSPEAKTGERS